MKAICALPLHARLLRWILPAPTAAVGGDDALFNPSNMPDSKTVPPFQGNISFNAQHSPVGAFMSFTCGHFGTRGGFGLQSGRPGDQDLYIGVKDGDRFSDSPLKVLPFYHGADADEAARYDVEKKSATKTKPGLVPYTAREIKRHYGWATDRWVTKDFEFTIYTPFEPLPDYESGSTQQRAIAPTVVAELTIDNTKGKRDKTGVFAMRFSQAGARLFDGDAGVGFAWRGTMGVRGQVVEGDSIPFTFMRWQPDVGLKDPAAHMLGSCPGIGFTVPPGERITLRLALGAFLDGIQTTGLEGRYYYTRIFGSLSNVLDGTLANAAPSIAQAHAQDRQLLKSELSPDQQFLLAHATRSYHGSTQLLDVGGQPFWIVNEGEYCMMNTLDLSVDHVFWELQHNPWVVRNLLNNFVRHYSFVDQVKVPKAEGRRDEGTQARSGKHIITDDTTAMTAPRVLGETRPMSDFDLRPGGISFTHDMGVHNNFSPFGHSSYELPDLVGCFSHMTAEQLCNWSLMAACYVSKTDDRDWVRSNLHTLNFCLNSLVNRGGEAGFCQYDSDRCRTGAEITTYDSLDHSLAQTRANVYMATKTWAAYLGLARTLESHVPERAAFAREQAKRVEDYVLDHVGSDGVLPAVFERDNPGYHSRILPAIEGLVYAMYWNDPALKRSSKFVEALKKHTVALLSDPKRRNLFKDGGLRLSSTSANSWMSKIALFQHVARKLFKLDRDKKLAKLLADADRAHVGWQVDTQGHDGSAYWACSDQMVDGVAKGSKYYPRIVTSILWMNE